jgi:hypothetical protein
MMEATDSREIWWAARSPLARVRRVALAVFAGACLGLIANIALIAATALLDAHLWPWLASTHRTYLTTHTATVMWAMMIGGAACQFALSGLVAGLMARWLSGLRRPLALGAAAGGLTWAGYMIMAGAGGGTRFLAAMPWLYAVGLVAAIAGGALGAAWLARHERSQARR